MKKLVLAIALTLSTSCSAGSLDVATAPGRFVHILPSRAVAPSGGGQLACHAPCVPMSRLNLRLIFTVPVHLQDGSATGYSPKYQSLAQSFVADIAGSGLLNIGTQYPNSVTGQFPRNASGNGSSSALAGVAFDPNLYPHSNGCNDTAVPNGAVNCINDSQIQSEIQVNISANPGWIVGPNQAYVFFVSSGEGVCLPFSTQCSDTTFCGYHSFFTRGDGSQVIYAVIPYVVPSICVSSSRTSPNGDPVADTMTSILGHEILEMFTRPIPSGGAGWIDSFGQEIGDKCLGTFGTNTYPNANQQWNGHLYEIQTMWNNHATVGGVLNSGACDQNGPIYSN